MTARVGKAVTLVIALALALPGAGPAVAKQDGLDLSLGTFGQSGHSGPKLSLGSVGLDSRAGDSWAPAPGEDPYYFMIPSERPSKKVPGIMFKIPLDTGGSR